MAAERDRADDRGEGPRPAGAPVRALLWAWVAAALVVYGAQFRHLAGPVLRALGLT